MLLLEPSTSTQHDSISSNQNHTGSLGCQLHVSKRLPKTNLTLRSGRATVLVNCSRSMKDLALLNEEIMFASCSTSACETPSLNCLTAKGISR